MRVGSEYRWVLNGYTPDTIPMARLAEYMQQLAKLLGEETSVHFERVEKGSVALVSKIDGVAAGRVNARVACVAKGKAPLDALRAYNALNAMLANDNGSAVLKQGSAVVIRFPGKVVPQTRIIEIPDTGTVIGRLYGLAETKDGIHARIRLESGGVLICTVTETIARKLRDHLFETVKVFGSGVWARGGDGGWTVVHLDISDVVTANRASLRVVVDQLRSLEIEWPDDPLGDLEARDEGDSTIQ